MLVGGLTQKPSDVQFSQLKLLNCISFYENLTALSLESWEMSQL